MGDLKIENNTKDNNSQINKEMFLSARGIEKRFGRKMVLKGINLDIQKNEKVAIVGGNGAGKTTLLNILSRNDKKFSGDFHVDVKSSEISFQFQTLNYPNEFSLYKLLEMFTVKEKGVKTHDKIVEDLKSVDLYKHRFKFPSELSGGQLQKFNLLMTMATKPKLIFFDEILSGLDQPSIHALIDFIKEKIHGKATTITISHSPEEIYALCDRVIILKEGVIDGDYQISEFKSAAELEVLMKKNILDEDEINYDRLMFLDKRYETFGDGYPSVYVNKIKKWYDLHDVLMGDDNKGVTAQFDFGDSVAIIGRNGSGKSTFAEIVAGTKKASKGKVDIDIFDIHSKPYHRFREEIDKVTHSSTFTNLTYRAESYKYEAQRDPQKKYKYEKKINKIEKQKENLKKSYKNRLLKNHTRNIKYNRSSRAAVSAIQFQKQFYPSFLNLRDVIVYNLQLSKVDYDELYIDYILECIGLMEHKFDTTHSLSGGQRQKLNIILSIIKKPSILILDELTTGLDLLAKEKLLKLIKQYIERENVTLIIVTHSMEDILKLANRLILIDGGTIAYDKPFDSNNETDVSHARNLLHSLEI